MIAMADMGEVQGMQTETNAALAAPMENRRINYVLIDHENVQPTDLALLNRDDVRLWVFIGAGQTKLSSELAIQMQTMRERADYVRISGNGPNALDFHIAFHIGQKACEDPRGFFHIISRDTGFDPLLTHLKSKKILACRSASISEMPLFKPVAVKAKVTATVTCGTPANAASPRPTPTPALTPAATPSSKKTQAVSPPKTAPAAKPAQPPLTAAQRLARMKLLLGKMKTNKPASLAALKKHIAAHLGNQVEAAEIDTVVEGLKKSGVLKVEAERIAY